MDHKEKEKNPYSKSATIAMIVIGAILLIVGGVIAVKGINEKTDELKAVELIFGLILAGAGLMSLIFGVHYNNLPRD